MRYNISTHEKRWQHKSREHHKNGMHDLYEIARTLKNPQHEHENKARRSTIMIWQGDQWIKRYQSRIKLYALEKAITTKEENESFLRNYCAKRNKEHADYLTKRITITTRNIQTPSGMIPAMRETPSSPAHPEQLKELKYTLMKGKNQPQQDLTTIHTLHLENPPPSSDRPPVSHSHTATVREPITESSKPWHTVRHDQARDLENQTQRNSLGVGEPNEHQRNPSVETTCCHPYLSLQRSAGADLDSGFTLLPHSV